MTLRDARCKMAVMTARLVEFAISEGFEIALDEGVNHQGSGHMPGSLHYIGLAQDVLLYKDGHYLTDSANYDPLGVFWEGMGGAWGGRFSYPDGNHFSVEWASKK
jgi:hypothetical protein